MRHIVDFLMQMEGKRWRVLLAGVLVLGAVSLVFALGKQQFAHSEEELALWLSGYRAGPWGLVAAIVLFTAAAFVGAPQFILIGLCVLAFGPWHGFAYSWIATVVSAAVTYWLGRGPAALWLERIGGEGFERMKAFVGRNAFVASFIIRNVPSAPFIVVNSAFGAVRAGFWGYLTGCALGVLPKTAMVAFFGGGFMTAVKGDGVWTSVILSVIGLTALAVMLWVREIIRRR
ncbi:TVP38/TMEM64 family protein [Brevundimonas sp.]|uniref:TVP38/TMEM64 family protein n=1 Tax=Brevundimonas sp. TaxID=1871086 RepID=UPI0028977370|nr:VTT domain-containing protein [Brevundimonas sp.]